MAKQIIWSRRAQNDREEILKYWLKRNQSNEYSKKLNNLFKKAVKLVATHPEIGKPTDNLNARIKVVRDYLIVYETDTDKIYILCIWDSRQNPDKLKEILKK
ncbi:MAG: type II toxin-antitoxin system RelE/ParE family toxin [Psychroflexus sp.]